MCDFCDGKKAICNISIHPTIPDKNEYVSLKKFAEYGGIRYSVKRKTLEYDNSGAEYSADKMLINYCPICGKDLREGEDKVG